MLTRAVLLAAAALTLGASPGVAGFEWTPPAQRTAPPAAAAVPPAIAMPAGDVDMEPIGSPVAAPVAEMPVSEMPVTPAPVIDPFPMGEPVSSSTSSLPVTTMAPLPPPVEASDALPPMAAVRAPASVPAEKQVFAEAQGFGSDIPLVMAMHQIVPAEYAYSFDPGVDQSLRVSWNGGKPWNEVLEDALRPYNLRPLVAGHSVRIRATWNDAPVDTRSGTPVVPATPLPIMAPPPAAELTPEPLPLMAAPAPVTAFAAMQKAREVMPPQSYPRRVRPPQSAAAVVVPPPEAVLPAPVPASLPLVAPPASVPVAAPNYAAAPLALTPPPATALAPAPMAIVAPPPATPSAAPVMDPYEIRFWHAEQGEGLKDLLTRWSSSANVAMLWNSSYDYALPAPVRLHGTFSDAVTQILMNFNAMDPRPLGRLHPNLPQGPSVLVIENYSSATN